MPDFAGKRTGLICKSNGVLMQAWKWNRPPLPLAAQNFCMEERNLLQPVRSDQHSHVTSDF